jgi:hypothetical protein
MNISPVSSRSSRPAPFESPTSSMSSRPSPFTSPATSSATSSPMMQQSARLSSRASSATASPAPSSARSASSVISKSERKKLLQQKIKGNQRLKSKIADVENTKKIVKQEISKIKRQQTARAGIVRKFIDSTFYKIPPSIGDISNDINKLEREKIEYNAVLINILNAQKILQTDLVKQDAKVEFVDTSMAAAKIDRKIAENETVLRMIVNDINGVERKLIQIDKQIQELKQLKAKELKIVMEKNALEAQLKQEEKRKAAELKEEEKRQKDAINAELKLQKANISAKEKEEVLQEQKVYASQLSQYLERFNGRNEIIMKINQYKGLYEAALKERADNTVGITGRFFKSKEAQIEMNYRYDIANINSKAYYANMKLFENLYNDKQKLIKNYYAKIMNQSSVAKMKETERLLKIKDGELIDNLYIIPSGFAPKESINEAKRINDLKKNEEKEKERQRKESIANALLMEKAKNEYKDARMKSREVNERLLSAEINKQGVIYDKVNQQVISERINQQRAALTDAERINQLREQASRPVFDVAPSSSAKTSRRNIQEIIAPSMTMSAADAERERKRLIRQKQEEDSITKEEKARLKQQKEVDAEMSKFMKDMLDPSKPRPR